MDVKGISHITGGGFYENMPRMLPDGPHARRSSKSLRPGAAHLRPDCRRPGNIPERDMFNTFNMGVGMSIVVPAAQDADQALDILHRRTASDAYVIGERHQERRRGGDSGMTAKIAVLVSGGGTNLQALIDAQQRGELGGGRHRRRDLLQGRTPTLWSGPRKAGIPGYVLPRKDFDSNRAMTLALVDKLQGAGHRSSGSGRASWSSSPKSWWQAYPNAILNVHPALIPSFCGTGLLRTARP